MHPPEQQQQHRPGLRQKNHGHRRHLPGFWASSQIIVAGVVLLIIVRMTVTNTQNLDKLAPKHHYEYQVQAREPRYNFTSAICLVVKDGEAYMQEWIDYHLLAMKFDVIHIINDSPSFELRHWHENTRNHSIYKRVSITPYDEKEEKEFKEFNKKHNKDDKVIMQTFVYRKCLEHSTEDYIAFIDNDEFFVLPPNSPYQDIRGVLQDYLVPYGGALTVNWMMVGSSNRSVYSPLPVTKRFQLRNKRADQTVKTIVKASDFVSFRSHAHGVFVRNGTDIHSTKSKGAIGNTGTRGATDPEIPDKVLLLYHYRYLSEKEYSEKRCDRGDGLRGEGVRKQYCKNGKFDETTKRRGIPPFVGEVFDDTPWQFLKERVPKYKLYDEYEDFN